MATMPAGVDSVPHVQEELVGPRFAVLGNYCKSAHTVIASHCLVVGDYYCMDALVRLVQGSLTVLWLGTL